MDDLNLDIDGDPVAKEIVKSVDPKGKKRGQKEGVATEVRKTLYKLPKRYYGKPRGTRIKSSFLRKSKKRRIKLFTKEELLAMGIAIEEAEEYTKSEHDAANKIMKRPNLNKSPNTINVKTAEREIADSDPILLEDSYRELENVPVEPNDDYNNQSENIFDIDIMAVPSDDETSEASYGGPPLLKRDLTKSLPCEQWEQDEEEESEDETANPLEYGDLNWEYDRIGYRSRSSSPSSSIFSSRGSSIFYGTPSNIPCNFCRTEAGTCQAACHHLLCLNCQERMMRDRCCPACAREKTANKEKEVLQKTAHTNIYTINGDDKYWKLKKRRSFKEMSDRQQRQHLMDVQDLMHYLAVGNLGEQKSEKAKAEDQISFLLACLKKCIKKSGYRRIHIEELVEVEIDDNLGVRAKPNQTQLKISEELEEAIRARLGISFNQLRLLKSFLILENKDCLNPTNSQEIKFNESIFGNEVKYITDEYSITDVNGDSSIICSVKISNLRRAIEIWLEHTYESITNEGLPSDVIQLKMSSDRGGGFTKIAVSLINRQEKKRESIWNYLIVAIYDGDDDAKTLRLVTSDIFAAFDQIRSVKIRGEEKPVKRIFIADLKGTAAVKGLKGAASRRPCNWCEVGSEELRAGGRDLARTTKSSIENVAKASTTHTNRGYYLPSLLNIDETTWGFAGLHIFQEAVSFFFKLMESDIRKIVAAACQKKPIDNTVFQKSALDNFQGSQQLKKDIRKMEAARDKIAQMIRTGKSSNTERKYCAPNCVIGLNEKQDWIACDTPECERWEHRQCVGILARDAQSIIYTCSQCNPDYKKIMERLSSSIELERESQSTADIFEQAKGHQLLKNWKQLCSKHVVSLQAYHSGCLSGNHCRNFLKNVHHFTTFLKLTVVRSEDVKGLLVGKDLDDRVEAYSKVLLPLHVLQNYAVARVLTADEVTTVTKKAKEYGYNLKIYFPEYRWKPKTHELFHHLEEVAVRERSYGLYSEQGAEAIHKSFNWIYALYENSGSKLDRMEKATNYFNNRGARLLGNKYALIKLKSEKI